MVFDNINNNRLIVARRAAEVIMEEGITDYLFAKKKAAKSLGLLTSDNLPSNQEIDNALKEYQNIFQEQVDSEMISKIKKEALTTMCLFKDFNPHLTGQLLEGLIPKFPKIQINLFTDNIKEVEYTLLNNNIAFDIKDTIYQEKLSKKKSTKTVPTFILEGAWFPIELKVYFENDMRSKKNNILSNKGKNIKAIKEFKFDSTTSSTSQLPVQNM
ncbi:hypothetical protein OAI28_00875 [Methylophilaceae bacterium]|jgi:hypothetical protein|nr:hypothetical protein [Methylophilaceae bacterium]|tara:strand:- start:83 stop:724 length:642 start_codon:yes stop_codon:yes gene_type:complete